MYREDQSINRNKETPISNKNTNEIKDRKIINSFNFDAANNKSSNYINKNEIIKRVIKMRSNYISILCRLLMIYFF
jgi:hypothetical protein